VTRRRPQIYTPQTSVVTDPFTNYSLTNYLYIEGLVSAHAR
jgi:hypothetical protein